MPSGGENPRGAGLGEILEGLLDAEVDFILVGGLAAVIQGAPVVTMDVDIVHKRDPENISRLLAFLKSIGACHRLPGGRVLQPTRKELSGTGHVLLKTRLGPLDILGSIEGGQTYEDLVAHIIEIDFRGYVLRVLDLRKIAELKRSSSDPKDAQRLAIIEETLRQLEFDEGE